MPIPVFPHNEWRFCRLPGHISDTQIRPDVLLSDANCLIKVSSVRKEDWPRHMY
jgi:hypothetical protein